MDDFRDGLKESVLFSIYFQFYLSKWPAVLSNKCKSKNEKSGLTWKGRNMDVLVRKARRHDKEAFALLMEANIKSMYKVAKAILKNDEDAADAMQETVLACWEKIDSLKKNDYFKTWLIRILINKCTAIYRQRQRFVSDEQALENTVWEEEYANVEWREFLNSLDEKYRTVIILYYAEGFRVKEIAEMLQISESAVKGRLATAREKVEHLYEMERSREII